MTPEEVSLSEASTTGKVMDELRGDHPIVLLQMPAVQALIAPATRAGVQALSDTKVRLPGKNYGSAIGSLESFSRLARGTSRPSFLESPEAWEALHGAFFRICIAEPDFASPAVRAGTHQGLLLANGPHRALFEAIEQSFAQEVDQTLFDGHGYSAPLCTSANLSGDPLGSIVDDERALEFARSRGVRLWVHAESPVVNGGSYPILSFSRDGARVERTGPELDRILGNLPPSLPVQRLS